jgi:hypothetical protein
MAYLFMLSIGLAFMTKGPAGIAIPVLTLLGYCIFNSATEISEGFAQPYREYVFLFSAFAWYAWILITMPDIAQQFFSKQVDETFISGTHQQPVYWYLAHAIEFFAPWSLLLIPAGIWCYQHRTHSNQSLPKIVHYCVDLVISSLCFADIYCQQTNAVRIAFSASYFDFSRILLACCPR